MSFADPLAVEFRAMFQRDFEGLHRKSPSQACRVVAEAGGFDFELPADVGGLDLGLAPVVEMFSVLGRQLVDIGCVEATAAAVDLLVPQLQQAPAAADRLRALRQGQSCRHDVPLDAGASACLPWPSEADSWAVAGAGAQPTAPDGWWSRRLLRHGAYLAGVADATYTAALDHCRKRRVADEPLRARQLVADRLVRQFASVRLAWSSCRDAAWRHASEPADPLPARHAHALSAQAATTGVRDLLQLLGARGLTERSPGPALYRLVQRETRRFPATALVESR